MRLLALLVSQPGGNLARLSRHLEALRVDCVTVADLESAFQHASGATSLSFIAVDEDLEPDGQAWFTSKVGRVHPRLPVIIYTTGTPSAATAKSLRELAVSKLGKQYGGSWIKELVKRTTERLSVAYDFAPARTEVLLHASSAPENLIYASNSFLGHKATGHWLVGASKEHLGAIRNRVLPSAGVVPSDCLDLLTEICNHFSASLRELVEQSGLQVVFGFNFYLNASVLRTDWRGNHEVIRVAFEEPEGTLVFELCFEGFDAADLRLQAGGDVGAVQFL